MDSNNTHTNQPLRPSLASPAVLAATWFGSGYLPKAPGSWGSMAALPFAWVLQLMGGNLALLLGIVVVFAIGIWSSAVFMKMTGAHDPGVIVIDEVAGQWIVLLAAIPGPLLLAGAATPDPVIYAMGFFLFRLFDVLKPWPISLADKNISGPLGVMVDDVLAGIAGLAVLIFALNWLGN